VRNKYYILILISSLLSGKASAQDVHFSQFFESATLRNPALTGIYSGDYKLGVNYRNQWSSFAVPFQTALFTAETKALLREATRDYLSFGLTALYDKAGSIDFTGTSIYAAVNYNKALGAESQTYLSVGLCGGYIQRSFDISKMRFANQFAGGSYNANAPTGENLNFAALHHWDASAGVSLSGALSRKANYYIGLAGYHVSKPTESYFDETMIRLTTRWSANFGISARLGNGFGLTAHANYQQQQPYQEVIGGLLLSHGFHNIDNSRKVIVSAGCFYRFQDAIIPTLKMDYNTWSLTMSYDITLAGERMYLSGFGGYELSLSMRGSYKHRRESELMCPRFELTDIDAEW
jgi:type IX secretion system PorP/SprF family membrane protein